MAESEEANELALPIRWPKYQSFSFSISPSNEYSGLISFRTDWFDLLAFQGILKSLLQHHSSKTLILQLSAIFMIQLLHPYVTCGKTIEKNYSCDYMELCCQSDVSAFYYAVQVCRRFSSKEQVSFNFMPASLSTVILEPQKIKSATVSIFSPSICHEVMELDAMVLLLFFFNAEF